MTFDFFWLVNGDALLNIQYGCGGGVEVRFFHNDRKPQIVSKCSVDFFCGVGNGICDEHTTHLQKEASLCELSCWKQKPVRNARTCLKHEKNIEKSCLNMNLHGSSPCRFSEKAHFLSGLTWYVHAYGGTASKPELSR